MKNFRLGKKDQELSKVPSRAIAQCLDDLKMCEENPDYKIDMGIWHEPSKVFPDKCKVCLGGARLARLCDDPTENVNLMEWFTTVDGREPFHGLSLNRIRAMDFFRKGDVLGGLQQFFLPDKFSFPKIYNKVSGWQKRNGKPWPYYHEDPEGFHSRMGDMVNFLEEVGL